MIGEPVQRKENPALLRGEGRYTDHLNEPGQAYAYIVGSTQAYGVLNVIDTESAEQMPGVLAICGEPGCINHFDISASVPRISQALQKSRVGSV